MEEQKNKLAVLFPGTNYTTDKPLLYYAEFAFEMKGYEILKISYGDILKDESLTQEEAFHKIAPSSLEQLQTRPLAKYENIVFISKSFGTVVAGFLGEQLGIKVRHIFLTPVHYTLPYLKPDQCRVIAGTRDKHLEANVLYEHCQKLQIPLIQIEGVGHSMEYDEDVDKSIEVLRTIVGLYN